jgi:ketosteroid isomerase-like protein
MAALSDEKRIRALIGNWAAAVRAKDMAGILAHHTRDIVMFDVPPPLQSKGLRAYQKTWELFFRHSSGGPRSFELIGLRIIVSETVAFGYALLRIGGEKTPQCRLTLGLRKVRSKWWIAHEHHSAPAK